MQNTILDGVSDAADDGDVASRVARETLTRRADAYASEVRRLLDAALEVMRTGGAGSRLRVADIVAAAGLSNDAFYRHFKSKDALVAALLEDGALRLQSYLAHQMDKESKPGRKIRRFVHGVLSQADEEIANTTLGVLRNSGGDPEGMPSGRHFAATPLAALLHQPLTELGCADVELHAMLAAHAVLGRLSDHLSERTQPSRAEVDRITEFVLAACH